MRSSTFDEVQGRIIQAATIGFIELHRVVPSDEVARAIGYSHFHFQRLFRALTAESWATYHRRLRLELAAGMVQEAEWNTAAIARKCGFESPESFIRAFRNAFGCAPMEFRSVHTDHPILPSPNGVHAHDPDSVDSIRLLRRPGQLISFDIKSSANLDLIGIHYQGPLQFVSQAWLDLNDWAAKNGVALENRLLVTCASDLDDDLPPNEHTAWVAIDDQGEIGLAPIRIGAGKYLVAKHVGSGHLLADFWLRAYAETIPQAQVTLRDAPAFQVYTKGLFVDDPNTFETEIYIPIEEN